MSARGATGRSSAAAANGVAAKVLTRSVRLGPVLVTPDEIPNPNELKIRTVLNGENHAGLEYERHDFLTCRR